MSEVSLESSDIRGGPTACYIWGARRGIITGMSSTAIPADRVGESIDSLRAAQRAWEAVPVRERLRPVRALRHLLATECDALCDAAARDLGKSTEETLAGDLLPLAAACKFLERRAAGLLRPRRVSSRLRPLWLSRQSDVVYRRPRGVVGIIGTWNYPLFLNGTQMAQALAAGNAVLWKPSEVAPSVAAALLAHFHRAGFPADLVQMLEPTRDAGPALTDAAVDFVVLPAAPTSAAASPPTSPTASSPRRWSCPAATPSSSSTTPTSTSPPGPRGSAQPPTAARHASPSAGRLWTARSTCRSATYYK